MQKSPNLAIREWRENPCKFVWDQFQVEPDKWQERALKAFASKDPDMMRISLQACAGPGKAQPHDTMIPYVDGLKRFGDLKIGDRIFGSSGQMTRVTNIYERGVRDVYLVKFSDGASTEVCNEHLWTVYKRGKKITVDTAWIRETLKNNSRRVLKLPTHKAVEYRSRHELPIEPYLLGCWLGDGDGHTSRITCYEPEIIETLNKRGVTTNMNGEVTFSVYRLITKLKKTGMAPRRSHQKLISEMYLTAKIKDRIELLRGIMDTDGYIDKRDGHCEIALSSEQLIDNITTLVRSLGGLAKRKKTKKPFYNNKYGERVYCKDSYRLTINTPFNPFRLKRKAKYWRLTNERYRTRYIESVKLSRKTNTRCISVAAKNSLYLTNDFIVTHNTACLSWMGWNFLACYGHDNDHPKGACVSVTADNLRDNLWPEFAKWQSKSKFLTGAFTWMKERIFAKDHPETWFLSARTWAKSANPEEQGRTLSGLHSKFVLCLIDESGDIPLSVLKSGEQALSNCEFGKIVQSGNPTSQSGMLYAAAHQLADQWHVIRITGDPLDNERSKRIDIDWAKQQIETYGRDDPWVKAYILGEFPEGGINSLLTAEEVEKSMARQIPGNDLHISQKRLGIDVAREGLDSTVIFPRQGLAAFRFVEMRGALSHEVAARVMQAKGKWGSELEMVDNTGGYGAGVVDSLIQAGQSPLPINFSGKPMDGRYHNIRAEMWFNMAEWVKRGGCLPLSSRLKKELVTPRYSFKNGKFIIEPKDQIKKRLGFSPDIADALALTFAIPDLPASTLEGKFHSVKMGIDNTKARGHDHDPFRDI